jgi:hypothetical protein
MRASLLLLILSLVPASALADERGAPYYPDHVLTREELQGKSLRELDLMRNTIYARAGNVFRKAWLRDHFKKQPWYTPTGLDRSKLSEMDKQNAATIGGYTATIPRDELMERLKALNAKGTANLSPEEKEEFYMLMRALLPNPATVDELAGAESNPLDDPSLLDRPITPQMLSDMSARDLRLLRNLVFARRGRPFKDPLLREYFGRMDWYKADPRYSDKRLTRQDHRNLKVIQTVEAEVNAPFEPNEIFHAA